MTPWVARTSLFSLSQWSAGCSAMHSMTSASTFIFEARETTRFCSRMFAPRGRKMGTSRPSGRIMRASVPVVFAAVRMPAWRSAEASRRVTLDLPRVPLM